MGCGTVATPPATVSSSYRVVQCMAWPSTNCTMQATNQQSSLNNCSVFCNNFFALNLFRSAHFYNRFSKRRFSQRNIVFTVVCDSVGHTDNITAEATGRTRQTVRCLFQGPLYSGKYNWTALVVELLVGWMAETSCPAVVTVADRLWHSRPVSQPAQYRSAGPAAQYTTAHALLLSGGY